MTTGMIAMMVTAGLGLAVQAAVNSRLREGVGNPILGALLSFVVGAVALALLLATGAGGRTRLLGLALTTTPWWAWIGGLCGAFYVAVAVVAVPRLGTALVIGAAVLGQLTAALALDSLGWFGVARVPLTAGRALGAVLLLVGVVLMQRKG